jgi:DNA replication licensing factor MCM7
MGHYVTVRGMVTRVSNVKPKAQVMAYSCDRCGFEIFQEVSAQTYTPIGQCSSEDCKKNGSKGSIHYQLRASKFIKFQEIKLQELVRSNIFSIIQLKF